MMETNSNVQVAASEVGVRMSELSPTTQQDLEVVGPEQVIDGLYFVQRFKANPQAIVSLQTEAKRVLSSFVQDPDLMIDYGSDVLEAVRRSGQEIRRLTGDVELDPEDDKAMRDLTMALKNAEQYDPKVAANVEKMREMMDKLTSRFGRKKAQAYFEAFKAQRMSIEKMVESMRTSLGDNAKKRKIVANAIGEHHDNLEEALLLMSERLAVLQIVRQLAEAERARFPEVVDPTSSDARYVRDLEMFQRMLQLKIEEYAQVWYTSVNMSPGYLVQQETHTMVAFKLKSAATHGMDLVEEFLAQLAAAQDLAKDTRRIEQTEQFTNDMLLKTARQARSATVGAARVATRSSLTTETMTALSNEFAGLITDVRQVYREAADQHDVKMRAIEQGVAAIEQAQAGKGPTHQAQLPGHSQSGNGMRSITAG